MHRRSALFFVGAALLAVVCALVWHAARSNLESRRMPLVGPASALWLPLDAKGTVQSHADGSADVTLEWSRGASYELVSASLIQHFKTSGWTERPFESLNPANPTSFADGWFVPHPGVHRWAGEWTRDSGEFVGYSLVDVDAKTRGHAYYLPPSLARRQARIGARPR
jgi:hypothetical protein